MSLTFQSALFTLFDCFNLTSFLYELPPELFGRRICFLLFFFDIFFKSGKLPLENTDFVQNCYVDYKRFRHEHFIGGEGGVVGLICGKRKLN